ncbi:uncharacterized protein SPSK_02787 [Sporothrix schenckii 1099-18]|uniref:Uncharacterized protein n=1 Tax=Sporothrix schenckii 1099-18 TaxID=1397361 RepID=A0A0F2ME95_SPOSC|nr:uncharacterized protein SPSK_02787 [Sporothrix schenckii 1099-18]KJR86466.1 hypothetical protein SPSK_02787 [Sporothrix schenckii 1099-18]
MTMMSRFAQPQMNGIHVDIQNGPARYAAPMLGRSVSRVLGLPPFAFRVQQRSCLLRQPRDSNLHQPDKTAGKQGLDTRDYRVPPVLGPPRVDELHRQRNHGGARVENGVQNHRPEQREPPNVVQIVEAAVRRRCLRRPVEARELGRLVTGRRLAEAGIGRAIVRGRGHRRRWRRQ